MRKLFEAKQKLNKFLKQYPAMLSYQKEIEKVLSCTQNKHNRMLVLRDMMIGKLVELNEQVNKLKELICRKQN
jgi:hypothetical protein